MGVQNVLVQFPLFIEMRGRMIWGKKHGKIILLCRSFLLFSQNEYFCFTYNLDKHPFENCDNQLIEIMVEMLAEYIYIYIWLQNDDTILFKDK